MKLYVPEYLLCEDPASEKEQLFVYHTPTRSLVHIVHTDSIIKEEAEKTRSANRRYFDYTYTNGQGKTEAIIFIAEVVESQNADEQTVLEQCAHWYACYLGWEADCEDIVEQ